MNEPRLLGKKRPNHRHRDVPSLAKRMPFNGPVASGGRRNRAAHGDVTVIDYCTCGAKRKANYNGIHKEFGRWEEQTKLNLNPGSEEKRPERTGERAAYRLRHGIPTMTVTWPDGRTTRIRGARLVPEPPTSEKCPPDDGKNSILQSVEEGVRRNPPEIGGLPPKRPR